jgi:hypothetical protein
MKRSRMVFAHWRKIWGQDMGTDMVRGRDAYRYAPPRTKPYVRLSRIRLPPRLFDGEALIRPRMLDARLGCIEGTDEGTTTPNSLNVVRRMVVTSSVWMSMPGGG